MEKNIRELSTFVQAPPAAERVVTAVMILLGEKDTSQKGFKAIKYRFIQRLTYFQPC